MVNHLSRLLIACLLVLTIACKQEKKNGSIITGGVQGSADFDPYIESFKQYMASAGQTADMSALQVTFSDTMLSNQLGTCFMGYGLVKINRTLWASLSAGSREELIFHELGHCVLNRLHNTTLLNGDPVSIMYPYHLGSTYLRPTHYPNYIAELFSDSTGIFAGITFRPENYVIASYTHDENLMPLDSEENRVFRCQDED